MTCLVDIDSPDYEPRSYACISYRHVMSRVHTIAAEGRVIQDVPVFRVAYRLMRLGWFCVQPPGNP